MSAGFSRFHFLEMPMRLYARRFSMMPHYRWLSLMRVFAALAREVRGDAPSPSIRRRHASAVALC